MWLRGNDMGQNLKILPRPFGPFLQNIWRSPTQNCRSKRFFFCFFFRNDTMRRSHILQCDIATFKAPFIYYVITCRGGGQKMPIFDYMITWWGGGGPKILKMRLRNIWMVPKAWRIVPGIPRLSKLSVFCTKLYKSSHGQCGHLSDVEMLVSR